LGYKFIFSPKKWPKDEQVEAWLKAYHNRIRPLDHWIQKPQLEGELNVPKADTLSYGVEKVMIVDEDILVDSLVLNQWHIQNKAYVISSSGYPSQILPLVNDALKSRADLPIFLYHGTGEDDFEKKIKEDHLIHINEHPIKDLGLNEETIHASKTLSKRYAHLGINDIKGDQMPVAAFTSMMSAMIIGDMVFDDVFSEEKRQAFEASLVSDFG
jgi:hypothetical protein